MRLALALVTKWLPDLQPNHFANWHVWCDFHRQLAKVRLVPRPEHGGNLARFNADGSLKTLRVTMDGAGHNQNFLCSCPRTSR